MMYLDVIQPFEIVLWLLIIVLFLVTGFLNLKDLKKMRQEKWTKQDSGALMLRILFYAFLLNFLLTMAIGAGILLLTALSSEVSIQLVLALTPTLQVSFGALVVSGVTFGLAKWKDWYDLVDAEY
jgi:fatty acid desaturase